MINIWERWNDRDRVRQQFWALKLGDLDDRYDCFFRPWRPPDERVLELRRWLEDWLQKRKTGQVY